MTSPHEGNRNGTTRQLWICSKLLWAGWSQLQRLLWRDRTCSYLADCELESISVGVVTILRLHVHTGALEEAKPSTQQGFIADRLVGPSATTDSGFESRAGKPAAKPADVFFFLVFFLFLVLPLSLSLPLPPCAAHCPPPACCAFRLLLTCLTA